MAGVTDQALRARAKRVIPGGMYGHQSVRHLPPNTPQFFARAEGAYLWDADDQRYLDLMCAYGPNLFGYGQETVDEAYIAQLKSIDVGTGPTPLMVDLAEQFTDLVSHAHWAIFCKNGTDATSMALMAARAHAGKRKVLVAQGAYHGAANWCTPMPAGTVPEDRAHLIQYEYNSVESLRAAAAAAGDDLAGIFASPFKHDVLVNQQAPEPAYAQAARALCDEQDALLIVDDVRAGFRIARDCSWSALGIEPDLSSWGKAIANGHPLSALLGNDRARAAAESLYVTGSYWFAGAAMAASLATLKLIRDTGYLEHTIAMGQALRDGLQGIADEHGLGISQTGPVQMPLIMFDQADGTRDMALGSAFAAGMIDRGVYVHPFHNMFISAAVTDADIAAALDAAAATARALPSQVQAG
ncbi:MAG: aminotransferase class III-fold pyridoxal phosphate-dependent enzyme [Pseudomonadota bacterium]